MIESLIIAGNELIKNKITSLGYDCKLITSYSRNPNDEINKAIDWIKKWPDIPISNGKSFKDILVYEGISIFWFLETRLYLYRIQSLIPLIEQIQNCNGILKFLQTFLSQGIQIFITL